MGGTVPFERDGAVATLTLSRPERLNAIVPELIDDLEAALDRAEEDPAIRVVRLRGAGRAFCAGYDIAWGAEAMEQAVAKLPANQLTMMKLLVNQAYDQMGVPVTQLVDTLLDGVARHTPEGAAFTRDCDAPFGDYGQEGR